MKMKKIFVAGHNGMVGSAICRQLILRAGVELVTRSKAELDLCNQDAVKNFFETARPDEVIIAAAKVGGISANSEYPADFIYQNLQMQCNLINLAHITDVQKLLFLGSSCIYPKLAKQPIKETELMNGYLEPTNEPYAVAKIAGLKLCESYNRQFSRDYRSIMPTNLYGPGDNYHPQNSHVVPALIRRFHEAKINGKSEVIIWGSGKVYREFLYVDDMAEAAIFVMDLNSAVIKQHTSEICSHINVGTGSDISIFDLAHVIKKTVGFEGQIITDSTKPDGTPKKLLDIELISKLGWQATTDLKEGLILTYKEYLNRKIKS